jgi:hypothetical protein
MRESSERRLPLVHAQLLRLSAPRLYWRLAVPERQP